MLTRRAGRCDFIKSGGHDCGLRRGGSVEDVVEVVIASGLCGRGYLGDTRLDWERLRFSRIVKGRCNNGEHD